MNRSLVIHETIHSPYFIFVRCNGAITDTDILQRFGLAKYSAARCAPRMGLYAVLADDGEWTMLADNWHYQLWHRESTGNAINDIATTYDVFTCSVGDSDDSFDFIYYRNGKLVRKYVVTDPHYSGGTISEDIGESLKQESDILANSDGQLKLVLALAKSVGIRTDYAEDELRVYVSPDVAQRSPEIVA